MAVGGRWEGARAGCVGQARAGGELAAAGLRVGGSGSGRVDRKAGRRY